MEYSWNINPLCPSVLISDHLKHVGIALSLIKSLGRDGFIEYRNVEKLIVPRCSKMLQDVQRCSKMYRTNLINYLAMEDVINISAVSINILYTIFC